MYEATIEAKIKASLRENPKKTIERLSKVISTLIEKYEDFLEEVEECYLSREVRTKHYTNVTNAITKGIITNASITKENFPALKKLFIEKRLSFGSNPPTDKIHDFSIHVEDIFSVRIEAWYYSNRFARTKDEAKILSSNRKHSYPYGDFSETFPIPVRIEESFSLILSCEEALKIGIPLALK